MIQLIIDQLNESDASHWLVGRPFCLSQLSQVNDFVNQLQHAGYQCTDVADTHFKIEKRCAKTYASPLL